MDPLRRRLLVSLGLAPVLAPALPRTVLHAAEPLAPVAVTPLVLRAFAATAGEAPSWRYGDGSSTLRVRHGDPVRIALDNRLPIPTSLDLQGVRVSPPLGGAGPLGGTIAPGASAEVAVTPPDAGTFWFHPWLLDPRCDATAAGLAGVLVVAEREAPEVDADLVAVLSDRRPAGIAPVPGSADVFRIDGAELPRREALRPGSRVRLRLVNASTRQAVRLACTGAAPAVVAIDGQPSALFRPRGAAVPLGPGARCDLMFDMPRASGAEVAFAVGADQPGGTALLLRAEGDPRDARGPILPLPPNPLLPRAIALETSTRATLSAAAAPGARAGDAASWSINGLSGTVLPKAPLFRTKRGSPVTLTFRNANPDLVAFRVHGFALRVLHDLDDGWEPYWRESIMVQPGATHHAAFVADLPGRWLIESPFFAQAAGGLRTWFEVS